MKIIIVYLTNFSNFENLENLLEFFVTKILVATVLFLDFHVDCYLLLLKNSILFILPSLNIFYSLYVTLKCFFNSEVLTFDR